MFDINTIVNAAIAEAVNAHLTEVLQQHANIVAALAERIAALENQAIVTSNAVDARIAVLENNPAQGVDSTLERRVTALESETQGEHRYLNRDDVAELIAEAMDEHTSTYDHDSYDSAVSALEDVDLNNIVSNDNLEDVVRDAVSNMTFEVSVS